MAPSYTASRELGHGSEEMVRRIYGHLGTMRHRSEVVEYRMEQHLEALKDRLGNVGIVTGNVGGEKGRGERTPRSNQSRSGGKRSGVGPARLERATSCSGGKRSIQLSYGPI